MRRRPIAPRETRPGWGIATDGNPPHRPPGGRGSGRGHQQGLIHRDIKPANILLENGVERVKITDFGLARAADDMAITRAGEVFGTPQYMSPEQARGEHVDQRSDLFSLGSVLYAMCTGRPPFRGDSLVAVIKRVTEDTPRPIAEVNPEVPAWLVAMVNRLLEKDPDRRFQTAAEVGEVLGGHLANLQHPAARTPAPPPAENQPTGHAAAGVMRAQHVPARMTLTAYGQGIKNALVCGAALLAVWLLTAGATSLVADKPIQEGAFGWLAFGLLWGLALLWFLATWLYGRQAGGQVLLDCGPHPTRTLFLFMAFIFLFTGITGLSASKILGRLLPSLGFPSDSIGSSWPQADSRSAKRGFGNTGVYCRGPRSVRTAGRITLRCC